MQKYRLLKDLPRAEAGTIVCITEAHSKTPGIVKINIWNEDEIKRSRLAYMRHRDAEKWIEEIPEKQKSIFDLKIGDTYYSIISGGMCINIETNHIEDTYGLEKYKNRLLHNNAFLTEEEARKELNKIIAIQKIKKYCWENGIDTEYEEERNSKLFYIETDGEFEGQINFDSFPPVFSPIGYFSYENADKILEKFPEELKLILS